MSMVTLECGTERKLAAARASAKQTLVATGSLVTDGSADLAVELSSSSTETRTSAESVGCVAFELDSFVLD